MITRNLLLSIALGLPVVAVSTVAHPHQAQAGQLAQASSKSSQTTAAQAKPGDLSLLFSRIWRVTSAANQPAPGSIYIFLPNGTLLQTSCVETYRIATWRVDKAAPQVLRVTEDGRLAYTDTITRLTDTTLQVQRTLTQSKEKQLLTLAAVQKEFVCPDLRK